jgi:hypothetical protein
MELLSGAAALVLLVGAEVFVCLLWCTKRWIEQHERRELTRGGFMQDGCVVRIRVPDFS